MPPRGELIKITYEITSTLPIPRLVILLSWEDLSDYVIVITILREQHLNTRTSSFLGFKKDESVPM